VMGGRLFTAMLGIVTLLLTARLAGRLARSSSPEASGASDGMVAALLAAGLLGLNLYHVHFTSMVKTYGAAGLLTVAGVNAIALALHSVEQAGHRMRGALFAALSAGAFGLAAGTRLSAGILLPATWLPLAVFWWRGDTIMRRRLLPLLIGMLTGGTLSLGLVLGPFLAAAPQSLAFGLLDYHAARHVGSLPVMLVYKAGFLLRLCAFYFPLLVVGSLGLAGWWYRPVAGRDNAPLPRLTVLLWCGLLAVTLVHLAAPFPYDDYQVFIMPYAVLLAAPAGARLLRRLPLPVSGRLAVTACTLALLLAHSLASPLLQAWLVDGRDRIWWPLKSRTDLQGLREAAATIRSLGAGRHDDRLLTQDTYLAVEAGLRVPSGMELGPFCFFPGLDDAQAARLHVLNETRYRDLIAGGRADLAAFSDWGLAIQSPGIEPLAAPLAQRLEDTLQAHYEVVERVDRFGQGGTTLRILRRRTSP